MKVLREMAMSLTTPDSYQPERHPSTRGRHAVFSNRHRSISTGFLVVSRKPLVGMWRQTVLLTWTEGVQVVFSTASLGWMFRGWAAAA